METNFKPKIFCIQRQKLILEKTKEVMQAHPHLSEKDARLIAVKELKNTDLSNNQNP